MLHESRFQSSASLAKQLAEDLAQRMRDALTERGRVCLAVSGGSTPVAFFQALSQCELDWSKVLVTLVDERWVDETDSASNARLVKENLLQNAAATAYFLPLKNAADSPVEGYMECENRLHELINRLDFAVLGMGTDGHTASWFPHSNELAKSLDEGGSAWCCPVLDEPTGIPRMTLTWSFLADCRHLYLHFEGDEKNAVYAQACDPASSQDIASMPVRTLLFQSQVPLSLYRSE